MRYFEKHAFRRDRRYSRTPGMGHPFADTQSPDDQDQGFGGRHGRHRRSRDHGPGDHGVGDHGPGEHGSGGRAGRGGRGGRGRRLFDHGELRYLILQLIGEKPRHGYDIIKAIEDLAAGTYSPSPGVIYPTLTLMEDLGQISQTTGSQNLDEGGKKLYAITTDGTAYLADHQSLVEAILNRLSKARLSQGDNAAPEIIRSMENLKTALRLRLSRDGTSAEDRRAIAAIVDAAALAVERQ